MTSIASIAAPSQVGFNVRRIREDFPILRQTVHGKPLVYLDNAATTQKPRAVLDALMAYYSEDNANVHRGVHLLSERATQAFEDARATVQRFINASSTREIVFTRNATEAINLVAQTFGRTRLGPGDEVIISTMEHHSNIVPWQMVCGEKGASLRVIPITDEGALQLEEYERLLGPHTRLVSIVHLSNVLGTINPVKELARLAHAFDAIVVVDGAQSVPHMPVDVQDLGCDFLAFSSHKMLGPTGVGVLYGKTALLEAMDPFLGGGEMIKRVTYEEST
ncbi:MAG: aminotransferase class V-fold PLP-dependent enzyme, partial [Steroidobacteraceae bacterium]